MYLENGARACASECSDASLEDSASSSECLYASIENSASDSSSDFSDASLDDTASDSSSECSDASVDDSASDSSSDISDASLDDSASDSSSDCSDASPDDSAGDSSSECSDASLEDSASSSDCLYAPLDDSACDSSSECSDASLDGSAGDSSSECSDASPDDSAGESSSEYPDVSLEGYTSSIDSSNDDSHASDEEVEDEKSVILNFYKTLSKRLMEKYSVGYFDVVSSIQHLMRNYGRVSDGTLPTEIDYTDKSNCIGYLHRYAACHTSLVFDAVSDILSSSSTDVLSAKLKKKSLNVVFLGGGPGNDFVGFLTALYGHLDNVFDLDVTVVDKMSGWEDVFNETVASLRRGDGGKAGEIFDEVNVMITFIAADLKESGEWDENVQSKLENADIVFFVKALSHIPDDDKLQVLQNVVNCMELESLLIYIDFPYPRGVFASLTDYLRPEYQSWKTRYSLGQKDSAFMYSNIDTCRAEARVFVRCENDCSGLFF